MTAATTISRPATGRPVRRLDSAGTTRTARPVRPADSTRPADRRHGAERRTGVSCAQPNNAAMSRPANAGKTYARRRAWATAAVVGVGLMMLVAFMMFFGGVMDTAGDPASTGTAVVRVGQGESLGDIASRIAPGMPASSVIEKIMELNAMSNSALAVGQPLVTPVYAR